MLQCTPQKFKKLMAHYTMTAYFSLYCSKYVYYLSIEFSEINIYGKKYVDIPHSRATKCLQKIRGTDYVVFVLI